MSHAVLPRRRFLRSTAALTAAGVVTPYWFTSDNARAEETESKNDRLRVGAIGVGGRGLAVTQKAARLDDIVAVCEARGAYPSTDHVVNFFDCVKTRKQPCTPVQVEHRSITACHLTNLSIRLKRKLTWDPIAEQIVGDDEANACQEREQRGPYLISG